MPGPMVGSGAPSTWLDVWSRVTHVLGTAATLGEAAEAVLPAIGEPFQWDVGVFWTLDDEAEHLRCVAFWHRPGHAVPRFEEATRAGVIERGADLPGRVWGEFRPLWVENVATECDGPRAQAAAADGLHTAFAFPVRLRDGVLGVLELLAHGPREIDPDVRDVVTTLGRQIGQFVGRQRAEEVLGRRVRQAALGADIGVALARADTLRAVLQRCAEAVVTHLDAAFARIWTHNPATNVLELQASAGMYTHIDGPHSRVPVGKFKIGLIAEERAPHLTNEVVGDPRVGDQEWAKREGMQAFAGYPLMVEDRLVGVIAMFSKRHLPPDVIDTLASIANTVAQGIERRGAHDEVRRLNATLERRVTERTAELAEANRELEAFSSSVSHDLRAPFRHISGFAELLERRVGASLDEQARGHLGHILSASRQAASMIDALLEFSRMGRAALQASPVALDAVVEEVRKDLELEPGAAGATWTVAPLPVVMGDPLTLRLALRNLLSNALKYSRGRPERRIEVGSYRAEDEIVVFVRDNGVGFDPRYAHKLFGVFQRLHTASEFEGVGIGLANVRRIVVRHGGRTWAESTPGAGATFYFSLPRAREIEHGGSEAHPPR